jgi:AcrR family transcriptional regulator
MSAEGGKLDGAEGGCLGNEMLLRSDQRQRTQIRQALLDLCFERGFAALNLEDLLERSEVDRPTFERYYADLEDCFYVTYAEALEGFRQRAAAARARAQGWRERVRVTAYALYRFLADDEKLRRFTTAEVRGGGERVQLLFGEEVEALFDLIDEGRREPGAPVTLTRATAEQIGGGIFNQLYVAGSRGGPMPPEGEIIPQLMYAVVLPYLGDEAAREEFALEPPADLDAPRPS